jgi:hypothetical protein|tara:strand:+ start:609 stop:896 length:288 start_codon:yes stop_codon:yes gene_type:complete
MTKKVVRPILPIAPEQYDPVYVNQLARTLDILIDEVRDAQINFQGIPSSGAANSLESGDFYIGEAGFLRVVNTTDIFSGSVSATGSIGTVTVAVS